MSQAERFSRLSTAHQRLQSSIARDQGGVGNSSKPEEAVNSAPKPKLPSPTVRASPSSTCEALNSFTLYRKSVREGKEADARVTSKFRMNHPKQSIATDRTTTITRQSSPDSKQQQQEASTISAKPSPRAIRETPKPPLDEDPKQLLLRNTNHNLLPSKPTSMPATTQQHGNANAHEKLIQSCVESPIVQKEANKPQSDPARIETLPKQASVDDTPATDVASSSNHTPPCAKPSQKINGSSKLQSPPSKAPSSKPPSKPPPTPERLACDEIDRLMSLPVDENPSFGVMLLPTQYSNKEQEEKKDEVHDEDDASPPDLIRDLLSLLSESDEPVSDSETHCFSSLLQPALPMIVRSDRLTAKTTSEIMSLGVARGISIPVVERLLHESEQLIGHATRDRRQLYRQNPMCLVSDLIATMGLMANTPDETHLTIEEEDVLNVETFRESYAISDEAIEVHADVNAVNKEKEEPWWKVASKLHGYAIHPPVAEMTPQQLLRKVDDTLNNGNVKESSLDDEIKGFWNEHRQNGSNPRVPQRRVKPLSDRQQPSAPRRRPVKNRSNKAPSTQAISAVASVTTLVQRRTNRKKGRNRSLTCPWHGPACKRTENHAGFTKVDKYSLYTSTQVETNSHCLDPDPWEARLVKQRFLYEPSITGRNWFGTLRIKAGNVVCPQPVCRPTSMEMPMDAESWTEDWIKPDRSALLAALGPEYEVYMGDDNDDDSDCSWEETPECGKLKNIIVRPGELVSRLSPDYTSSLRRSRWRKKYVRR